MGDVVAFRPKRLSGFIPDKMPPLLARGRDAGSIAEPRGLIEFARMGQPPVITDHSFTPNDCA